MPNIFLSLKNICFALAVCLMSCAAFSQAEENYYRFLDSADVHIDTNTKTAELFLDSIPKPIEEFISGRLSEYYAIKVLIHDDYQEYSKLHHCNVLALKYAELEGAHCIAGQACIDLFSDKYFINSDTTAYKYLEEAKLHLEKCETPHSLVQVEQTYAYAKYLDGDAKESNSLILPKLNVYKAIKKDAYYYMFALHMLACNFIYLEDIDIAHKHYNQFKTLENDTTITKYNYYSFKAGIDMTFAYHYYDKKQNDSLNSYLDSSMKLKEFMSQDVLKEYFVFMTDIYKDSGEVESYRAYVDSIARLEKRAYEATVDASFEISNTIFEAKDIAKQEHEKKIRNRNLVIILFILLTGLSLLYFVIYRKQKRKEKSFKRSSEDLNYLKSNNEQLAIKVHGLEEYINSIKDEVRSISKIDGLENQKAKIRELYKKLHINSATVLDKSDGHLDLLNNLNTKFFTKINTVYPQLSKSEVILCYYVLIGFTNKEMALFLNTSVRSVESKRYRISKKMNFDKDNFTLLEHLQNAFKDTLENTSLSN